MKTIFIVGITGFLGRNLAKILWKKYKNQYKIIGTGLSPNKINLFKTMRRNWGAIEADIPVFCVDIVHDNIILENIFQKNKIDYIIHAAALKYIDIAEKDPLKCIEINLVGSLNILKLAKKYNVANIIAISTDKSNNPTNTYGMSKYLMEQIICQYNYSVYQGVNFFWSDGSVLDIWYRQIRKNEELCITNFDQERYYCEIDTVCDDIIENLNTKNKIILPSNIFKINLKNLYKAMLEYFNYNNKCYYMGSRENEKMVEDLHKDQCDITNKQSINEIKDLIDKTMKRVELSCI